MTFGQVTKKIGIEEKAKRRRSRYTEEISRSTFIPVRLYSTNINNDGINVVEWNTSMIDSEIKKKGEPARGCARTTPKESFSGVLFPVSCQRESTFFYCNLHDRTAQRGEHFVLFSKVDGTWMMYCHDAEPSRVFTKKKGFSHTYFLKL